MDKVINEKNQVAVVFSPKFGSGWYSWKPIDLGQRGLFLPELVRYVEFIRANKGEIEEEKVRNILISAGADPESVKYLPHSGTRNLEVAYVEAGKPFRIQEYNGWESIIVYEDEDYITP